ncbi:hypothetical protein VTI74DRAFT_6199 [Chaetomium olivicolor]
MARQCHVLIALHQDRDEKLAAGGTPEMKCMAEQTVMLMLKSFCPWMQTDSSKRADLSLMRSRLLHDIERKTRQDTGFQPGWRIRGTNILSPLFEFRFHDRAPREAATMQTVSTIPPHPSLSGMTVARAVFSWHRHGHRVGKDVGVVAVLREFRVGHPDQNLSRLFIHVPGNLTSQIRKSVEDTPSDRPFMATMVLELMGRGEHHYPYFGLPTAGPYKDFGAANALGIRIEWKDISSSKWFTAYLRISIKRSGTVADALMEGDSTPLESLYQEATALIQMIRGEEYPDAPDGFWRFLSFRGSRPAIQRFEVDHLQQTVRWIVPIPTASTNPPTRSRFEDNSQWLLNNHERLSPFMVVGEQPSQKDKVWYVDRTSTISANNTAGPAGPPCDTCTIIATCRADRGKSSLKQPCEYDSVTKTCPSCQAMNRTCTFTPFTKVLGGWVGDDTVDPNDYKTGSCILLPRFSKGPMRELVPHLGVPQAPEVHEIPEPFGWRS